jgi:hypothetical protein
MAYGDWKGTRTIGVLLSSQIVTQVIVPDEVADSFDVRGLVFEI